MKKDFESRFMPNVKFLIPKDMLNDLLLQVLYSSIHCECRSPFPVGALTSDDGNIIKVICNSIDSYKYFNHVLEVSIFEAMPEFIPDGMRYNKELDKLVPDVIQWQKVDNGGNHIAFDGTPFDALEEALHHNLIFAFASTTKANLTTKPLIEPDKEKLANFYNQKNGFVNATADIKKEYCCGIKLEFEKVADYTKDINIKEEDKQILDELRKSGKSYLEIIKIIKDTDTFKKHNGGDGNDYYDLPLNALQLQDLIEFKNMNANIKDIFKACWRKGDKKGVDEIYDVEKMVYYSLREAGKVLNTKDYISIATRIMGKQNVK